jgi:methionyl aminopeptidase
MAQYARGDIVTLKDGEWLRRQKAAGEVICHIHQTIGKMVKEHQPINLKEIENFAHEYILSHRCTNAFYQYKGFPGKMCCSLNTELVHGVAKDYLLKDGDVVKIDLGANFEGAIADCAFTYVYGKPKTEQIGKLLVACQRALNEAIDEVEVGKRIGSIGKKIFSVSKETGFGVIVEFGGHGIDYNKLHSSPFVPNKSRDDDSVVIQPGLSIAIEPMFVIGNNTNTKTLADKWTVITKEIGAHYEHSVTIDEDGKKHIITNHGLDIKEFL